jgi:hypothetical protein
LRWSAADLAREAALGANTVRRAEVAEEETSLTVANIPKALKVLKRAGVGKPPIKGDELPPRKKRAKRQAA